MMRMTNDMLSQEEIDALLRGEPINSDNSTNVQNNNIDSTEKYDFSDDDKADISDLEKDALGEIGNISMGTAATTLFALLRKKVLITTPKVTITNAYELSKLYEKPFLVVDVKYKLGLEGTNLLILKSDDAKIITDLMMGGDGRNVDRELNDMDLSAISEAMNQMVGSSSTSLSGMFGKTIDIDPPNVSIMKFNDENSNVEIFNGQSDFVKISFNMVVEDVIDSEIMQILPIEFAKALVSNVLNAADEMVVESKNEPTQEYNHSNRNNESRFETKNEPVNSYSNNPNENYLNSNENYRQSYDEPKNDYKANNPVNVKKVTFESFDNNNNQKYNESIEMLNEIPIDVSVELGRAKRKISEILEYGPGTIIELDKLVGEPLDILANGRKIAKGEVVVIDDNFGIRITEVLNSSKKIK